MKNRITVLAYIAIVAISFTSCKKDEGMTNNDSINYDALYVVNRAGNSLSIVNLSTDKVQKTINLGSPETMMGSGMMNSSSTFNNLWPYHISLSPDKSKVAITEPGMDFNGGFEMIQGFNSNGMMGNNYIQHHNGNSTSVISDIMQMHGKILILDALTGDLHKEISVEGMPFDAIFSPDGKELWTSLMMPVGKVMVFDANSYILLNSISVGNMPAGVTFSDDGKKVLVANAMSGTVTVIDAITKLVTDNIATGQGIVGAYQGMNGMMYTDNEKDQTLNIINTMNNMMSDSIHLGFIAGMVRMNSMMNQIWASDPNGAKIHFWNQTGTGLIYGGNIPVGSGASEILFSKNGNTCYVSNQNDNSVSVIDVGSQKELMKIHVGEKPNGLMIRYK